MSNKIDWSDIAFFSSMGILLVCALSLCASLTVLGLTMMWEEILS